MLTLKNKLRELGLNLWWTWHPDVIELFREIDPTLWDTNHNPIALLAGLTDEALIKRIDHKSLESRINFHYHRLQEYLVDAHVSELGSEVSVMAKEQDAHGAAGHRVDQSVATCLWAERETWMPSPAWMPARRRWICLRRQTADEVTDVNCSQCPHWLARPCWPDR